MSILRGLKICFVAGTLGMGGAEQQLYYQVRTLLECGASPSVICFSSGEYWQSRLESLGVPVICVKAGRSRLQRLLAIVSVLSATRPAVMQAVHFYVGLYVVVAARLLGIRNIAAIRSDGTRDIAEIGPWAGRLGIWLPQKILVNSRAAAKIISNSGRSASKILYLPNVVDTKRFSPQGSPTSIPFQLVMVGRMNPPKRFDMFLRMLSHLNERGKPVLGHLIGDGFDRPHLEGMAQSLGLGPNHVCFHGALSDVERLYRRTHVCLHLSDWEGMPNTILEAMSCGLPVVATNVGGIPELIQPQTGLLVEPDDESGLQDSVLRLIEDEKLRFQLGQAGRKYVEQNHDLYKFPQLLENFYQAILL